MKVAALLPHVEVFGGVRRYLELGHELAGRGLDVRLFTPRGVAPDWLPFQGRVGPFSDIRKEEFDVGLCSEYSILPAFDALRARVKYFYFVLAGHRSEREVARRDYRFLANSRGLSRRLERRYGIDCRTAAGGVNPGIFHPLPPADRPPRAPGEFRVLCYGRVYKRRKGVAHAVRAVEGLGRRHSGLRLILFDTLVGENRTDPRTLIRPRIPHEFHLNLPQDRMAWLYGQADAFVSAERRAGWSNTAAEAMACGVAVVCTPSGSRDFAVHGETALVAPLPFSWLLRHRLRRLIEEPGLRQRLAEAGLRRIQDFTWARLADRLLEFFRSDLTA
ncbi:MAG: glycosyltransferase family 4 protein [Candidatus Aminicenantes bacterium]|nr:glycosyltransferase family 4 protein [Candidatus Aminicenantes bacterium]